MLGGVERYMIPKNSEKEFKHNIVNIMMKKMNRRLEKEMPLLLEKVVLGVGEELQNWNEVIKTGIGIDLRIRLAEYAQLNPVKWQLKVQGFCHCLKKQQQDEYILGWQKDPPSYIFQLYKIEYKSPCDIVTRKLGKPGQEIIDIWSVQPRAKNVAMKIALGMYGIRS